jgi:hypothetical protein
MRSEVVRDVDYYNLDAILSVGYRVNSKQGTRFSHLGHANASRHILRGYTLKEQRRRERGFAEAGSSAGVVARARRPRSCRIVSVRRASGCVTWSGSVSTEKRGGASGRSGFVIMLPASRATLMETPPGIDRSAKSVC